MVAMNGEDEAYARCSEGMGKAAAYDSASPISHGARRARVHHDIRLECIMASEFVRQLSRLVRE